LLTGYAHVFILLSVVIVTLPGSYQRVLICDNVSLSDVGCDCADYEDAQESETPATVSRSPEPTFAAVQTQSARH